MTILALYKLLLYGGLALLVGSLVALEVFLNWKHPLPPRQEKEPEKRYISLRADLLSGAPALSEAEGKDLTPAQQDAAGTSARSFAALRMTAREV